MDFVDPSVRTVYSVLDLTGVVLYGMIGATIARARNFDFVGIIFLAIITALGGGMVRDVLIDNGPPAALQDMRYFGLALIGAALATAIHMNSRWWELFRVHGDAVVLGVWAATGSSKALANGLPWSSALFLGVLTVVGGGIIGMIVAPVLGAGMMILSYWRGWKLPGTQDLSWAAQPKLQRPMTLARDMARRRGRMRRKK